MDVQNLDPRSIKTFEPLSCSLQGGRGGFPDLGQGGKAVGEAETKLHVGPFVAELGLGRVGFCGAPVSNLHSSRKRANYRPRERQPGSLLPASQYVEVLKIPE